MGQRDAGRVRETLGPSTASCRWLRPPDCYGTAAEGNIQELRERSTLYSVSAAKAPYSNVSRKRCPQHSMTSPARAASDSVICAPHSGQLTR